MVTVGQIAEFAKLAGIPASVLLDRFLSSIEQDVRVGTESTT